MSYWVCGCGKKVSENIKTCPYCKTERSPSKLNALVSGLKDKLEAAKPASRESKVQNTVPPLGQPAKVATNASLPIKCEKCSGDNIQTIKMACLGGSTTGTSTAFGINSSMSVGVAAIDSKSQTNLVATLRPGPKPSKHDIFHVFMVSIGGLGGIFLVLIGIASLADFSLKNAVNAVFALSIGGFILAAAYNFHKTPNKKVLAWNQKNDLYEKGWVCHKCGSVWIPGEAPINLLDVRPPAGMGIYLKTIVATSSFFILLAVMAALTPPITPSKASKPTTMSAPPATPEPELALNHLNPLARDIKRNHPDWSDDICTAISKGELSKGMNSQQVTAAMATKEALEKAKQVPLDLSVGMDEAYLPAVKGRPRKVNVTESASGTRKQYVYERSSGNEYVYTVNGKVTSWQSVE